MAPEAEACRMLDVNVRIVVEPDCVIVVSIQVVSTEADEVADSVSTVVVPDWVIVVSLQVVSIGVDELDDNVRTVTEPDVVIVVSVQVEVVLTGTGKLEDRVRTVVVPDCVIVVSLQVVSTDDAVTGGVASELVIIEPLTSVPVGKTADVWFALITEPVVGPGISVEFVIGMGKDVAEIGPGRVPVPPIEDKPLIDDPVGLGKPVELVKGKGAAVDSSPDDSVDDPVPDIKLELVVGIGFPEIFESGNGTGEVKEPVGTIPVPELELKSGVRGFMVELIV
ncbi:hypothetical protein F4775DRAFT_590246 [Biscogniauxia sp. FL1348]|nr:hypothetical protein F4775DRAFT_590246 [Biscogniauxia sp. FL1348]